MEIKRLVLLAVGCLLLAAGAGIMFHLHERSRASGPMYHVRTEFDFAVHAPYKVVAPLFGPEGERAWASDNWNPQFLYPQPARDIEGAVFQVSHGHHHATWMNTAFDLNLGHIQYVYVIPDAMATLIDIHLTQPDATNTGVHVAYERTALNAAANDRVREFGDADQKNGKSWGDDFERYFDKQPR